MKREVRLLLSKACDSLILSIESFNRPFDCGRITTTLILLDHAFEMLLKAAILHRGGQIRRKGEKETLGFDACIRKGLSDANVKFLTDEQALTLQAINGLRDAAQHYLLELSESQFYIHAQAGVTLFRDLLKNVFDRELSVHLPARVLPVSTSPPMDIATLFDSEIMEVAKLLQPGKRRRIEARARLRPLTILDSTIRGEKVQPSEAYLDRIGRQILAGRHWQDIFHGVAAINISASEHGPHFSLRLSKKEGVPVDLVPEGTPGASVVAVRRVNELDFYNLGLNQLAEKVGLTAPKTLALIRHLGLQADPDCFKEIAIGRQKHKRYSQKAIGLLKTTIASPEFDIVAIWKTHGPKRRPKELK